MKEKIIEIIGFGMEPERAELMARKLIILFNDRVIEKMKAGKDWKDVINDIFIHEKDK